MNSSHCTQYDLKTAAECAATAAKMKAQGILIESAILFKVALICGFDSSYIEAEHNEIRNILKKDHEELFRECFLNPSSIKKREMIELHNAVDAGNALQVTECLSRGIKPDCRDIHRNTPLHRAVYCGHAGILKILISNNAKPNRRNAIGLTPFDLALSIADFDCAEILWKSGSKVPRRSSNSIISCDPMIESKVLKIIDSFEAANESRSDQKDKYAKWLRYRYHKDSRIKDYNAQE